MERGQKTKPSAQNACKDRVLWFTDTILSLYALSQPVLILVKDVNTLQMLIKGLSMFQMNHTYDS